MKKEKQQQILDLTQELMVQWYMLKPKRIYSYLSERVIWIGAASGQFFEGRVTVIAALESKVAKMCRCSLLNQIYTVTSSGKDGCVVAGTMSVTLENGKMTVSEQQRVTFVWVQKEGKLWITHLHISNNAAILKPEETFPGKASQRLYHYIQQKLSNQVKTLTVYASDRVCYCIDSNEVDYLEAAKEYMIVSYKGNEIKLHRGLGDVQRELFPDFIAIHRSYYINPRFVWAVKKYQVQLLSGKTLPLSRSRYAGVLELLKQ